jgi:hypothetical protein
MKAHQVARWLYYSTHIEENCVNVVQDLSMMETHEVTRVKLVNKCWNFLINSIQDLSRIQTCVNH